jgi:hypothetical protein
MKTILALMAALTFIGIAHGEQTAGEKAETATDNVKRSVKKTVHRAKEMVCTEGDATCLAKKAKNRAVEGGDYVKDKVKEQSK